MYYLQQTGMPSKVTSVQCLHPLFPIATTILTASVVPPHYHKSPRGLWTVTTSTSLPDSSPTSSNHTRESPKAGQSLVSQELQSASDVTLLTNEVDTRFRLQECCLQHPHRASNSAGLTRTWSANRRAAMRSLGSCHINPESKES